MKTLKRFCKLFVPYGILRIWVEKRYGQKLPVIGKTPSTQRLHDWMPAFVAIINGQSCQEDRRPIKYWLPYGKMRQHVAAFYGMHVETRDFPWPIRLLRDWLPYGLILWWDTEAKRVSAILSPQKASTSPRPAKTSNTSSVCYTSQAPADALRKEVEALRKTLDATRKELGWLRADSKRQHERIEILLLKLSIDSQSKIFSDRSTSSQPPMH